jgi:hypothetical protein
VAGLIGAAVSKGGIIPAGQTVSIEVEPYLERVVFSFVKSDPATRIVLTSPTGAVLTPTIGGTAEVHHSIYRITNPDAGEWRALPEGVGEVRYWVDKQYPIVRVEPIESPSLVDQPITITASLVRNNVIVVDPALDLEVEITLPGGGVVTQVLSPIGGSRYSGSYEDVMMDGTYTITARAFLDDESLSVRLLPVTVRVFPLPTPPTLAPSPTLSPSATPTAVEQVTPTPIPTVTPKPPWAGLVPPRVDPFLWFIAGSFLSFLLWALWDRFLRPENEQQFMKAIRSRDYPSARTMLDKRDKLTGVRWLYRAEDYVCRKLYGPESEGRVVYKELVSAHLKKAKENYEAGEESNFETLRAQCAFVLECIKNDSFPTRLSSKIRDPFVRWFDDTVGIKLGDPRRVGELLSHTKDPDKLRELCQTANSRAIGIEREWEEESEPKYREATEQVWLDKGWGGVIDLWGVGEQDIARLFQRSLARFVIEKHQEREVLNAILNFANAGRFSDKDVELPSKFFDALCGIFEYASEEARHKDRDFSYLICREYAKLLWDVAHSNAKGILTTLMNIPDVLDMYDQGKDVLFVGDVYYLCYFLMVLDPERLSGGQQIHFYAEAEEGLRRGSRYKDLPDLLAPLKGLRVATAAAIPTLQKVRDSISQSKSIPQFEKAMVRILLQELEKVR